MPSARAIKQRIKSAKNISKITKAMEMVSASKMRRSQLQAQASRPYAHNLQSILQKISGYTNSNMHPLLEERSVGKTLLVIVSTDRGLVGGLNSNLFRAVHHWKESVDGEVECISIGKKAKEFAIKTGIPLYADFSQLPDKVNYRDTLPISTLLMNVFLSGEFKMVQVVHMQLINTLSQKPVFDQFLPISPLEVELPMTQETKDAEGPQEYLFEPAASEILSWLLPYYIENSLYFTLLEAKASEHSARMMSMKNASDNAKEVVGALSLEYNRSRQASITQELQEITTAQMSL